MHGIVLMQLKKHVEQSYGAATWDALLLAAGLPSTLYNAMGEYPDEDVLALVAAASQATGKAPAQVLEDFGRALVPDLVSTYSFLVQPGWDALDLIEHTESTIHTVVRTRDHATPPVLEVIRTGPDGLSIRYSSARKLCALARGIVGGVGDHYRTPLQVTEPTCMHRGATHCTLDVRRATVPGPRATEQHLTRS